MKGFSRWRDMPSLEVVVKKYLFADFDSKYTVLFCEM